MIKSKLLNVRGLSFLGIMLTSVACSSSSVTDNSEVANESAAGTISAKAEKDEAFAAIGYECQSIRRTGTHMKSRRCTTQKQRDRERDGAERFAGNVADRGTSNSIKSN